MFAIGSDNIKNKQENQNQEYTKEYAFIGFDKVIGILRISKLLNVVLTSPEMAGRTEREIYQRITALGSMCMSVCYSSVLEGKPDDIEAMKPVLYDIVRRSLKAEK